MATVVQQPQVMTRSGAVRGTLADGVRVFKGIPYAGPPYGANRLQPPQPAAPWTGVRDALTFGPKTPQLPYPPEISAILPELAGSGEDCLNLNVWSPDVVAADVVAADVVAADVVAADVVAAGRPVMVWIPGSAFQYGTAASPWYDGSHFARDGIVCVTLNYRVGVDGYLYLGDGIANLALLDQIAALRWVRDNIAAFGGDPGNVTVFGESAGAMSIGVLLAMPRAKGLFRRAILESGASHHVISPASALRVANILAQKLGVAATREAIATVPLDRLLAAQAEVSAEVFTCPDPERWGAEVTASAVPWQPVLDRDVIPAPPIQCIAEGASADVDILVGTNTDDWKLFLVVSGVIDRITDGALAGAAAGYGLPMEVALAAYRAAQPSATPGELLAAVQTDWWCRIPAIRLADAHAKAPATTYMYEFAWQSPQFDGRLGACHALEIPFVFDTLGHGTEPLWGPNPPQALADRLHAAWVAFARTGDPGWPRYDLPHRATMHFDFASTVVDDPRATERALWEGVR